MAKSTATKKASSKPSKKVEAGEVINQQPDAKNRLVTLAKSDKGFVVSEEKTGLFFTTANEATATNVFNHALTNSQAFANEY